MAWSDINQMSRQNISRMAETLGGMKQNQAGMMQQGRLQKEQLQFQEQENQRDRLFDALKTAGTMFGDYLSKSKLAGEEEKRAKDRAGVGGWQFEADKAMAQYEANLQKDIATLQSTMDREYQEWLYKEGGPIESSQIRAEGRAQGYETTAATTLFERQKELDDLAAKAEVQGKKDVADYEMQQETERLTPGSAYYNFAKESATWDEMANRKADLWFYQQLGKDPDAMSAFMNAAGGGSNPDDLYDVAPSLFFAGVYTEYMAEQEAAGGEASREGFEKELNLRLDADQNVNAYNEQFVADVRAILPRYLDKYFPAGEAEPAATKSTGGGWAAAISI